MFKFDVKAFGKAANWERLSEDEHNSGLTATASDPMFPGALLPLVERDGTRLWYAVTGSGAEWRVLQPMLLAFVGPTVTTFRGQTTTLDAGIAAERILIDAGALACARLVPGKGCAVLADRALTRLVSSLKKGPAGRIATVISTTQLLTNFELNLVTGDRQSAEQVLSTIRSDLRLDALNVLFLEVRLLSTFRAWPELASRPWFRELAIARKPSAVAAAMLEALWHSELESSSQNPEALAAKYKKAVRQLGVPLLAQISTGASEIADRLRELETAADDRQPSKGVIAQSRLESAAEAPSAQRVAEAKDAIASLSEVDRDLIIDSAAGRAAIDEIGGTSHRTPRTWPEWITALSDPAFKNAGVVARDLVSESPIRLIQSADDSTILADEILSVVLTEGQPRQRMIESIPVLLRWAKEDPEYPRREIRGIYEALLQTFFLLDSTGQAERDAVVDLLDCLLVLGVKKVTYCQLIGDLKLLVEPGAGQSSVYWLIDMASILLQHPTPDVAARLEFLNVALQSFQPIARLLSVGQRAAYNRIATGASWPVLPTSVESDSSGTLKALQGKSLAIYTLTESAGRQAEEALRELEPTLGISLAHDHVASPRLARLARTSDVFVLVAASAKHAATDCIMANRGARPLLYAAGRGFSGIIRAVEEYARSIDGQMTHH